MSRMPFREPPGRPRHEDVELYIRGVLMGIALRTMKDIDPNLFSDALALNAETLDRWVAHKTELTRCWRSKHTEAVRVFDTLISEARKVAGEKASGISEELRQQVWREIRRLDSCTDPMIFY